MTEQHGDRRTRPARGGDVELPGRGTTFVRHDRRSAGRTDRAAAARLDGERRPQLVHLLPRARRALPRRRDRPSRATAAASAPKHVPPRGLRRRRDRRVRRARHRPGDPRRLLDGRTGRAADVASPSASGSAVSCCARLRRTSAPRARSGSASSGSPASPPWPGSRPIQARHWLTDQFYLQRQGRHVGAVGDPGGGAARLADGARGRPRDRQVQRRPTWIDDIDVPTSVLITMRDRVVPVRRQVRLFEAIHGCRGVPGRRRPRCGGRQRRRSCPRCCAPCAFGRRALVSRRLAARAAAVSAVPLRSLLAAAAALRAPHGDERQRRCAPRAPSATPIWSASAPSVGADVRGDGGAQAVRHRRAAHRARRTSASCAPPRRSPIGLGNMKGALMKLGQMASYVDEALPAPLREALCAAAVQRARR